MNIAQYSSLKRHQDDNASPIAVLGYCVQCSNICSLCFIPIPETHHPEASRATACVSDNSFREAAGSAPLLLRAMLASRASSSAAIHAESAAEPIPRTSLRSLRSSPPDWNSVLGMARRGGKSVHARKISDKGAALRANGNVVLGLLFPLLKKIFQRQDAE
jgi:hypothetical protein